MKISEFKVLVYCHSILSTKGDFLFQKMIPAFVIPIFPIFNKSKFHIQKFLCWKSIRVKLFCLRKIEDGLEADKAM